MARQPDNAGLLRTRRRYGLSVPPSFQHPVEAAAWTYGPEPQQYSQLLRRT
ncbi:hypothetical protein [Lentzea aerocolonigenes]|uniref:hypothetical protein n=1 Tax=Lentzea aerocolonigenes TaxID=68170 RepID=UPI0012E1FF5C|nr:hypothetical protein [Lentzea aerocolonigenes]